MRKVLKWVIGCIVVFALIVTGLSYLLRSEMLRSYVEREANRHLKGYTVRVGSAYFHPFTFALDLQESCPHSGRQSPASGSLHRDASMQASTGGSCFSRRVVGDIRIDRPKLYINLKNVRVEEKSKVPLKQKGWQEALFAIYPLKVNVFTIDDGDLTYIDEGPFPPLHVSHVRFTADNIRNIRYPDHVYPSPIELRGPSSTKAASP